MSAEGAKWWTARAREENDLAKKIDALSCAIEEIAEMKAALGAESGRHRIELQGVRPGPALSGSYAANLK